MKYERGTFTITPNKEHLRGKPPEMQAVYFWICDRADENGICFPSRAKIAEDCGIKSVRTIDKYIKELADMEILVKTVRKTPGSVENTSNLYQIMILEELPRAFNALPSAINAPPGASNVPITIPNNYTQLSIESATLVETNKEDMKFNNKSDKSEKEKLILSIYHEWVRMATAALEVDEKFIDKKPLMRCISTTVNRETDWKLEDYKSLFKYFFADTKMAHEKKLSCNLCMSVTYMSQYKLSKKSAKKKYASFADVSGDIKL